MKCLLFALSLWLCGFGYAAAGCTGSTAMANFDKTQFVNKYWYLVGGDMGPMNICERYYYTANADGSLKYDGFFQFQTNPANEYDGKLAFTTAASGDIYEPATETTPTGGFNIISTDYTSYYLIQRCDAYDGYQLFATTTGAYEAANAAALSSVPAGVTIGPITNTCVEVTTTAKPKLFKKIFG